jgi:hypothetical protein
MLASARALLDHLIDYAGMFPPARLPLRDALRHYTRLTESPEAWMLGRFVILATQLQEMLAVVHAEGGAPALSIAALGRGGADWPEFWERLDSDLDVIESFRKAHRGPHSVDVVELTLPSALAETEARQLTDYVLPFFQLGAFLEVPAGATWQPEVQQLVKSLAAERRTATMPAMGLKIRCGGAVTPTIEQLAWFITCCRDARLPWKATAGLHHPLRHRDSTSGTMAHGFINVFAAGVLGHTHGLDQTLIAAILAEESIDALRFRDEGLGWRQWDCTVAQIREARRWMPSFGSCSFDEPCDGLRGLRLLP